MYRNSKPYAIQGIARDITEQKKAQLALAESEKKYRTIVNNMQDVFYRVDNNGRIILISPSAMDLLGYDSAEEILGLNVAESFYTKSEDRKKFLKSLDQQGL